MQYSLILVTQIVLLGVVFTVGAKVVDLSWAKVGAEDTCNTPGQPQALPADDGFRRFLSC